MDDLPKKVKLRNGKSVTISYLSRKDSVREILRYINRFVAEGSHLGFDKKFTLKEESRWKKDKLALMKKGDAFVIIARIDGRIASIAEARRGNFKERNNVGCGIGVTKECRRLGLGEIMLRRLIIIAKKKMKPKNIYLTVDEPNRPARLLYKKLGFREIARFRGWVLHKGKYIDKLFMKL